MKFYTVSELRQKATQIITELESTKEEVIITKNGKPTALIQFITEEVFSLKPKEGNKKHGNKGNL